MSPRCPACGFQHGFSTCGMEGCPMRPASPAPSASPADDAATTPVVDAERERIACALEGIADDDTDFMAFPDERADLRRAAALLRSAPVSKPVEEEEDDDFRDYLDGMAALYELAPDARGRSLAEGIRLLAARSATGTIGPAGSGPYCRACGASAEDRSRHPCGEHVDCPMRTTAPAGEPREAVGYVRARALRVWLAHPGDFEDRLDIYRNPGWVDDVPLFRAPVAPAGPDLPPTGLGT